MGARQILRSVTYLRARNNLLWMGIVRLAIKAKPKATRRLIAQISANDREITKWLGKL